MGADRGITLGLWVRSVVGVSCSTRGRSAGRGLWRLCCVRPSLWFDRTRTLGSGATRWRARCSAARRTGCSWLGLLSVRRGALPSRPVDWFLLATSRSTAAILLLDRFANSGLDSFTGLDVGFGRSVGPPRPRQCLNRLFFCSTGSETSSDSTEFSGVAVVAAPVRGVLRRHVPVVWRRRGVWWLSTACCSRGGAVPFRFSRSRIWRPGTGLYVASCPAVY